MGKFFQGCGATICVLIVLALLIGIPIGAQVAGYTWYKPWVRNQEYNLVRESNEYVDGKQVQITGLLAEYNDLAVDILYYEATPTSAALVDGMRAQQRAKVLDMCTAANKLNHADQIPDAAKSLMLAAGCWEGQ